MIQSSHPNAVLLEENATVYRVLNIRGIGTLTDARGEVEEVSPLHEDQSCELCPNVDHQGDLVITKLIVRSHKVHNSKFAGIDELEARRAIPKERPQLVEGAQERCAILTNGTEQPAFLCRDIIERIGAW